MRQRKSLVGLGMVALSLVALSVPVRAEHSSQADQKELAVTVYNDDLGLVREVRELKLESGLRELQYSDVAATIDPTSVSLQSLSAPLGLRVLEQNYEYDLMTPQKLLDKYVGQEVEILQGGVTTHATLLSTNEGQVYKVGDRIYLQAPGEVVLPRVPENLVARPTLKWLVQNDTPATQRAEVSYLAHGLSWQANYVLVVDADDAHSALNGWVTLKNQSGATYPNAHLTLVAGDVNRVRQEYGAQDQMRAMKSASMAAPEQFAERALFEYHSYQLNRATTLKDRQEKQLSLLSAAQVPTEKRFRFEVQGAPIWYQNTDRRSQKVAVYLEFKNRKADRLGIPLPKGVVRVYKQDVDGHLQFIGEDAIDHTPRDEKVRIKMGDAFDLVGERRQTNFRVLGERQVESTYEILLRNHKDEPVTIIDAETLGGSWEITAKSHPFVKTSATQVEFAVKVMPNKEERITYTVRTAY